MALRGRRRPRVDGALAHRVRVRRGSCRRRAHPRRFDGGPRFADRAVGLDRRGLLPSHGLVHDSAVPLARGDQPLALRAGVQVGLLRIAGRPLGSPRRDSPRLRPPADPDCVPSSCRGRRLRPASRRDRRPAAGLDARALRTLPRPGHVGPPPASLRRSRRPPPPSPAGRVRALGLPSRRVVRGRRGAGAQAGRRAPSRRGRRPRRRRDAGGVLGARELPGAQHAVRRGESRSRSERGRRPRGGHGGRSPPDGRAARARERGRSATR